MVEFLLGCHGIIEPYPVLLVLGANPQGYNQLLSLVLAACGACLASRSRACVDAGGWYAGRAAADLADVGRRKQELR